MSPSQVALVVGLIVAVDVVVIPLVIRTAIDASWGKLERAWPGRPVAHDAVLREFQSLRVGKNKFGGCVHIAVDEKHLHLLPARFLRWFGAGPCSVPWDALHDPRPVRSGTAVRARLGDTQIVAPAWAMEMAQDAPAGPADA